jgi:hypothetical protein
MIREMAVLGSGVFSTSQVPPYPGTGQRGLYIREKGHLSMLPWKTDVDFVCCDQILRLLALAKVWFGQPA